MNIRYFKKVIVVIFALVTLSPSAKSVEFYPLKGEVNKKLNNSNRFKKFVSKNKKIIQKISFQKYKDNLIKNSTDLRFQTVRNELSSPVTNFRNSKYELEIQSEKQSEENNILYAEGDVLVSYKGNILKADSLIYNKTDETINAIGNIYLNIGDQIFKMESFVYDFNKKKGYFSKVEGLIKTNNIIEDLFSNFETSDIKQIEILKELKKDKVLNTPNRVDNWIFFADKIEVDGKEWKTLKAIFTNDLLELNQVKLEMNSLRVISSKEELRFKSSLNYFILDEKFSIPFWIGNRAFNKSGEDTIFANRWNLGFDNKDKDGYFIGRKFNTINLFNDFVIDLEPQFLIQRSLKGNTKSFVSKGDSVIGNKAKRDTSFLDYFALNSQIKGKINTWDLEIGKQLNSFDSEKFSNALRVNSNLSKKISFLNSQWDKSFYLVYRDKVWNGSIGESEIYKGYGSKLEKQNTWEVNGINKTEIFSLGLANFAGEDLNSNDLVSSFKGNLFYSLDQNLPISVDNPSNKYIDSSYQYISEPFQKGLSFNTTLELSSSLYDGGQNQSYIGLGAGPEFIFGNFKNKSFDYTRISVLPFYKIKGGDSIFKFDQIYDKFTLDISFDQQLFGPIILKSNAILNIDSNSKDYGDFISSKMSLNWKKRSYELGVFYQPHNESGGIGFTLFGFE